MSRRSGRGSPICWRNGRYATETLEDRFLLVTVNAAGDLKIVADRYCGDANVSVAELTEIAPLAILCLIGWYGKK